MRQCDIIGSFLLFVKADIALLKFAKITILLWLFLKYQLRIRQLSLTFPNPKNLIISIFHLVFKSFKQQSNSPQNFYFGIAKGTTKVLQTIYNGYRMDIEWIQNGYRTPLETQLFFYPIGQTRTNVDNNGQTRTDNQNQWNLCLCLRET